MGQFEYWIFCVSLVTRICNVWRNMLFCNCRSNRRHFKCSVDMWIVLFCRYVNCTSQNFDSMLYFLQGRGWRGSWGGRCPWQHRHHREHAGEAPPGGSSLCSNRQMTWLVIRGTRVRVSSFSGSSNLSLWWLILDNLLKAAVRLLYVSSWQFYWQPYLTY